MVQGTVIWIAWPVVAGLVVLWQLRPGRRPQQAPDARRGRWLRALGAVALATYGLWICSAAFFPLPVGESAAAIAADFVGRAWVNLVPLRAMFRTLPRLPAEQIVRQFGGNLLLFVPFTLVGPPLWPRLQTWRWPLAAGLGGSLAIELIQLALSGVVGYPYRRTDIDDVILNLFGAFLGYAVFLGARAVRRRLMRWAPARAPRE